MQRYPFSFLAFGILAWSFNAAAAEFDVADQRDLVDATPGDGKCSTAENTCTLRAAIQESNNLTGLDIVNVGAGVYPLSLGANQEDNAAEGDLDLLDSVEIRGAGTNQTILDGMQRDRVFDVHQNAQSDVSVHLSGMNIQGGLIDYKDGYGGAIYNEAGLTITDVNFLRNQTAKLAMDGGALFNITGAVTLKNVEFNTNIAVGNGGALAIMNDGKVDAVAITFNGNLTDIKTRPTEKHEGGAVFVHGTLIARDSKFQDNSSQYGGAMYIHSGSATLNKVELLNNTSDLHGGAIHVGSHAADLSAIPVDLVITGSKVNNNVINGGNGTVGDPQGAGLFVTGGSHVYVYDTEFSGNDARSGCATCQVSGGAIASDMSNLILNKVQLRNNKAARFGGAIYSDIRGGGAFELNDSVVSNNTANTAGGGLSLESGHNADGPTIIGSTISNTQISNNASFFGGGIAGSARIVNSTISRNQAGGKGGGIFVPAFSPSQAHPHGMFQMDLTHVTIADNSGAPTSAGNQLVNDAPSSPTDIQGSVVIRNSIISGGSNPQNCTGPITSKDYNIDSDGSCNLSGANDKNTDPRLLPLANNGGPTQTHALDPQSPAIGVIPKASCRDLDQRYYYRNTDACDIGAFEFGANPAQTGTVQFALAKTEINERDGTLVLNIERVGGSQGTVSIDYMVMPMSATLDNSADPGMAMPMAAATDAAADFSIDAIHGMLTWADGDATPKQITVTVVTDDVMEPTETFQVELRNPIGPVIGTNSIVEVAIIDKSVTPAQDPNTPTDGNNNPPSPAPEDSGGGGGNWGWLFTGLLIFRRFARQNILRLEF